MSLYNSYGYSPRGGTGYGYGGRSGYGYGGSGSGYGYGGSGYGYGDSGYGYGDSGYGYGGDEYAYGNGSDNGYGDDYNYGRGSVYGGNYNYGGDNYGRGYGYGSGMGYNYGDRDEDYAYGSRRDLIGPRDSAKYRASLSCRAEHEARKANGQFAPGRIHGCEQFESGMGSVGNQYNWRDYGWSYGDDWGDMNYKYPLKCGPKDSPELHECQRKIALRRNRDPVTKQFRPGFKRGGAQGGGAKGGAAGGRGGAKGRGKGAGAAARRSRSGEQLGTSARSTRGGNYTRRTSGASAYR